jgi:alkylation response protein AidB-like acyl-CoA dehydrogenase
MDFSIPQDIQDKIAELDAFIEKEIKPLENENIQFFDKRREHARTDWDNDGVPRKEWSELLREMKRRADKAGHLRFALPKELGGQNGSNLAMAYIREHFAAKGLGLHNDLQDESSIVGNFPLVNILHKYGSPEQKEKYIEDIITGRQYMAFGLTEPDHGSDATWMETTARRDGDSWIINGAKRWNSAVHKASVDLIFARTSGKAGDAKGITGFIVPIDAPGLKIEYYHWTFNMPTDHAEVSIRDVRVPDSAILYKEGEGLTLAQSFVHQNRIRQAASSVGAARYCIAEAAKYARERKTFGKALAEHQAIQFPLAELHAEAEMLRHFIYKVAWQLDHQDHMEISDLVSIANYRANRLVCQAADQAMQVHGGLGYSRGKPFEHIYRHHRRYRITEGSEEIQIRKVAAYLFGYIGPNARKKPKAEGAPDASLAAAR